MTAFKDEEEDQGENRNVCWRGNPFDPEKMAPVVDESAQGGHTRLLPDCRGLASQQAQGTAALDISPWQTSEITQGDRG